MTTPECNPGTQDLQTNPRLQVPVGLVIGDCARCGKPVLVPANDPGNNDMECCPRCTHDVCKSVFAPAGVIDREAIARVLAGFEGEGWVYDPPILDGVTRESSAPEMYLRRADAVLAVLEREDRR